MTITEIHVSEKRVYKYHESEMVIFEMGLTAQIEAADKIEDVVANGFNQIENSLDYQEGVYPSRSFQLAREFSQPEVVKHFEKLIMRRARNAG